MYGELSASMNITMLVIKNTAAMDFALPLLWKIKQGIPHANVSVLYCTLSRKKILRQSRFYSEVLSTCGISQYDFADFLQFPYVSLRGLWRWLCSQSDWDSSPWDMRLHQFPASGRVARYVQHSLNQLEDLLGQKVSVQQILPSLNPDIVLLDHTASSVRRERDRLFDYFRQTRKKVVLLPHAPHHARTTAFTPFDKEGELLPDHCEFWMPFRFDRTWEVVPEKRNQFVYVGYPGLDSEWLEHITADSHLGSSNKSRLSRLQEPLKCLFVIRRFLPRGRSRGRGDNAFVYDYAEFSRYLNLVKESLEKVGTEIELIVKPHPSNDFQALKDVFAESEIPNWRITYDSIYGVLSEIDFVISLYSTVFFIPAMAGIPVVLLHSSTQSVVHEEDVMKQLYTGFRFYLANPEDLPLRLKEVIEIAAERRRTDKAAQDGDVEHLRYFYPDGALQRALERLRP
jgi:hypothetical protein